MCAIVGLIRKPRREFQKPQAELAREMLAKLQHRGPDGTGILEIDNVVLGHNRLSIIGIDNGQQPISSARVDVVVNGEFYRYEEVKTNWLPSYKWTTSTDSEILIPLYEQFGIDRALAMLDGEFAFILHDRKAKKIFAARDRFGVKPLAYRETESGIELASEVKAFSGPRSWNLDALCTGLAMHYQNLKDTIVEGISNVLPGHYLEIDTETGRVVREKCWWRPLWPPLKSPMAIEGASAMFKDLFSDAVKARMRSDARWCVSLSGGVDSSAVLGFASKISNIPLDSFTVSFPDAGDLAWNELAIARRTAKALGSRLYEVEMPATKMLELLEDSIVAGEGFAVNGHVSCKHALAKAVHDAGFKSMLVGEGADECLLGYSHLKVDQFADDQLASSLMVGTETPCGDLLMPERFKSIGPLPSFLKAKLSTGKKLEALVRDDFREVFRKHALARQSSMLKKFMDGGSSRAEKTMGAWLATAFPTYICKVLGDSQEMSSSVEARLPFLDRKLFEVTTTFPLEFKCSRSLEKLVLREASRGIVPDEVRLRPKQPFQAPPMSWFLSEKQWASFIDICCSSRTQIFDTIALRDEVMRVKREEPLDIQAACEPMFMLAASFAILDRKMMVT